MTRKRALLFTVGHSTRTLEQFIQLLRAHGVMRLVDVRTIPKSRHNPQFNRETLPKDLRRAGIRYTHLASLGGLRRPRADSANLAWRNASFRGYADYMQTKEFEAGLKRLIELAQKECVAVMCAEALPWRCHRSLIADALLVRGFQAAEIQSPVRAQVHKLTAWGKADGDRITYPAEKPTHL